MDDTVCMCTKLRRASRAITRLYDDAMAPAGINITQFAELRAIARQDTPTIGGLATSTGLDRSTMGRNVRVLARMGLVAFGPGKDERTRVVALTDKGQRALEVGAPLWDAAQAAIAERLGGDARATLFDLLGRIEAAGLAEERG